MLTTVATSTLVELSRRRTALCLVLLIPLIFYLVRIDVHWQAIRFLSIGVGWAVATLALFSHGSARSLDQRLAVIGASPSAIFLGRQLALIAFGILVAFSSFVLVAATQQDLPRTYGVALLLLTAVMVAAPLGALVSLLIAKELEGALALLAIMAAQLLMDPTAASARFLPMWSTRELTAFAIEAQGQDKLGPGLQHFVIAAALTTALAWAASRARLRTRVVGQQP